MNLAPLLVLALLGASLSTAQELTGTIRKKLNVVNRNGLRGIFEQYKEPAVEEVVSPLTPMLLSLSTMLTGQYNNSKQYLEDIANNVTGFDKHMLLAFSYVPVVVPVLLEENPSTVTLYYEQHANGSPTPRRQQILKLSATSPCQVRTSSYNIVNATRFSNDPEDLIALKDLQLSELSNEPKCDSIWSIISQNFYASVLATDECTFNVAGKEVRPEGTKNITCTALIFSEVWRTVSDGKILAGTEIPYVLDKVGNIYPVPVEQFRSVKYFDPPCQPTSDRVTYKPGPTWNEIKLEMTYRQDNPFEI